jgi:hypothetical protein
MRRAGYKVTSECSAPFKNYESRMKIGDEIMRGPTVSTEMPIGIRFAWTMRGYPHPGTEYRQLLSV